MEFTAKQIADLLKGEIIGNPDTPVDNIAKIEEGAKGCLSFIAHPKYEKYLYETDSSIILINEDLEVKEGNLPTLIRVKDARKSFTQLLQQIGGNHLRGLKGVSSSAMLSESAQLGNDVYLGPFVEIQEGVTLGDGVKILGHTSIGKGSTIKANSIVYSGAQVYHQSQIGENCIIHSGAVIGSDGFGFVPDENGKYTKVPQLGNVILHDDVEVGSNTCIDRATMGSTIIHRGVKLDNLVQIAHNVIIDEDTVIAAQSGIAGTTKIGKRCIVGGQVGFAGHLEIADDSTFNAQTGVSKSIGESGKSWSGTPAREFRQTYRALAFVNQIPELKKQLVALQKEIAALKGEGNG